MAHLGEVVRVVVAPRAPVAGDANDANDARADAVRIPCVARLSEARGLAARFANAGVREVHVMRAADLDARADASGATRVWLALECLQVTGSFKVRGALLAIARHLARGCDRVVAVSAGNHGAGLAHAARVLGARAIVCVPRTTPKTKVDRIRARGAELVVVDTASYDEAERHAQALARERGLPFLSPYDDEDVVLGNGASLGFEIASRFDGDAMPRVIAPFGGGGLSTGIAWALASIDSSRRHVWGAQTSVSPTMADSLERGAAIEFFVPSAPTLAEGLEGGVSAAAFERARHAVAGVVVVEEADIARAMAHMFTHQGVVVEGSAAAALAPILCEGGLPAELRGGDVVVILTGRNVDRERLLAVSC